MKRLTMILTLALVVAACAESDSTTDLTQLSGGAVSPDFAEDSDRVAVEAAAPAEGEQVSFSTPDGRKVIHRAAITIEANDTRSVFEAVQGLVADSGGFLESATVADPVSGEDQPRIELVLRIPSADLAGTLRAIGDMGTRVVSQSQRGQDVTEEYVDVAARITNLTLLETELRALLEEVRTQPDADPDKLLRVFSEISSVRGQIEQLEGRRQVLDDLTSLATVEVSVNPTPSAAPVVEEGWAPIAVARDALRSLVGTLQSLADVAIRLVLHGLPLIALLALPGWALWRLGRRLGIGRQTPTTVETTE
ncbi:DUF4349 domain-containing protein [soil metagenome]